MNTGSFRDKPLASERVCTGRRTYFLDIETYGSDDPCLVINESGKSRDGGFERHKIIVPSEFLQEFFLRLQDLLLRLDLIDIHEAGRAYSPRVGAELQQASPRIEKVNFAMIREKFPNAYAKWTPQLDEDLREAFQANQNIHVLAEMFERKPGAIQSRLRKLALVP